MYNMQAAATTSTV